MPKLEVDAPGAYQKVANLHQYYRDCLSQCYEFPSLGKFPPDLVRWAVGNTDTVKLAELLANVRDSGLDANQDMAFRLMLFIIQQANLALDRNNNAPDFSLPAAVTESIRQGLGRVLALHPHPGYIVDAMQVFYRIKATDDVIALSKMHPVAVQISPTVQAMMGFMHTVAGNYKDALHYLKPLSEHPTGRDLPLVALSLMTCRYLLGEVPTAPVTFETLDEPLDRLADQIARLAPLEMVQPLDLPPTVPVVFAACNDRYFYQHALTLAASIHATNAGKLALHLHLYSPNQGILDEVERMRERFPGMPIGVSLERDCPLTHPPSYFAMARFVRAHQIFSQYQSEFCIVDVDALFNKPWQHILAQFDEETELALACPVAAPFWEQVTAAFVYAKPAPVAREYLAKVAQFIARNIELKTNIWFTDQIALSACNQRFLSANPAVSHVPADLLIDIHQHPQAPIWAVSTRKTGVRAYDERREELGAHYGFRAPASRAAVYSHVSRVKAPVFFVQIGAMDGASFDPIHAHVKAHHWRGILVEPLPDMMDRLRNNYGQQKGLAFENVAITEQEERRTLYRVPTEAIKRAGLPDWVMGMSTFVPGKLDCYQPHVVEQAVACIPLAKLLAKHRPAKVDILQIDAEGYDFKILKQFDFARYRPSVVNFEFVNLNRQEKAEVETMLLRHGYLFYQEDQDVFAVRREVIFTD